MDPLPSVTARVSYDRNWFSRVDIEKSSHPLSWCRFADEISLELRTRSYIKNVDARPVSNPKATHLQVITKRDLEAVESRPFASRWVNA